jgi:uncharacterized Zn finger protein
MDPVQMNVNLEDTTEITCENCSNNVFQQGVMLRGISRFITMTQQDGVMPIPTFYCAKCGHVNSQFQPKTKPAAEAPSVEDVTEQPKRSRFPRPE